MLLVLVLGSLVKLLSLEPIAQNLEYHAFADTRKLIGMPNSLDVISNIPFLLVGVLGLRYCLRNKQEPMRLAWTVLFFGVALVSIGSAYYHWYPNNNTLVWDRLPMTIGFMGLFAALVGEYVSLRIGKLMLAPALLFGLFSVLYWHWTDDLRLYYWVQLVPLLTIPAVMILFRSHYSHGWLLLVGLGWYALAKVAETYDASIFAASQYLVSGHTLKHLFAAMGCYSILLMLQKRRFLERARQH